MGNGTFCPGLSMDTRLSKAKRKISFCCKGLFGAPQRMEMVGKAEIIIVGIPNPSTAL